MFDRMKIAVLISLSLVCPLLNIKMNDILKILFHLACHAIMKNKVFFQRLQTFANHLIKMEQTLLLFHIL